MSYSYYLKARLMPAALTSIPAAFVVGDFIHPVLTNALKVSEAYLPTALSIVLVGGIVYLLVQVNRVVAKEVIQRFYFRDEDRMPSTEYMLWSNMYYEDSVKSELHNRMQASFGISPLPRDEEAKDIPKAKKIIVMCTSQLRNMLRENRLLLQHNIEYGFMRNLLGGCLCAAFVALSAYGYTRLQGLFGMQPKYLMLVVVYGLPLLLSRFIMKRYGHYYAKVLFEQFLSSRTSA